MVKSLYSLRSSSWIYLVMIALGVAVSACGGSSTAPAVSPTAASTSTPGTRTFTVGVPARLIVNNGVGSIHVHTGSGTTVVVQATKHGSAQITMDQTDSSTVRITTHPTPPSFVDLDVTMPSAAQLQLQTGAGGIQIEGINGQVNAKTGSGSPSVSQARLNGNSHLSTGSGAISFDGALDPNGTYRFDTGSGSVHLTVPANSSLRLDLHTGFGSIDNSFGSNETGSPPRASVLIQTGSGRITITKR